MTAEEQQAACRGVAEAIGWKVLSPFDNADSEWGLVNPSGECVAWGTNEDMCWKTLTRYHFVLFNHMGAGAYAREQAEEWLYRKGWKRAHEVVANDGIRIWSCLQFLGIFTDGYGATLAEARAAAIIAAVWAMKG